nr:hypothetical protein CFP56_09207 [Quercus suber]
MQGPGTPHGPSNVRGSVASAPIRGGTGSALLSQVLVVPGRVRQSLASRPSPKPACQVVGEYIAQSLLPARVLIGKETAEGSLHNGGADHEPGLALDAVLVQDRDISRCPAFPHVPILGRRWSGLQESHWRQERMQDRQARTFHAIIDTLVLWPADPIYAAFRLWLPASFKIHAGEEFRAVCCHVETSALDYNGVNGMTPPTTASCPFENFRTQPATPVRPVQALVILLCSCVELSTSLGSTPASPSLRRCGGWVADIRTRFAAATSVPPDVHYRVASSTKASKRSPQAV